MKEQKKKKSTTQEHGFYDCLRELAKAELLSR